MKTKERIGLLMVGAAVIVLPAIAVITFAFYVFMGMKSLAIVSSASWVLLAVVLGVGRLCLVDAGRRMLGHDHARSPV